MTFECKMCGMCCRNIKRYRDEAYPLLKNILGEKMPEFNIKDNDGVCVNLMENNKCSIYKQRPVLCNTELMFELLSKALGIPKIELYDDIRLWEELTKEKDIKIKTLEEEIKKIEEEINNINK